MPMLPKLRAVRESKFISVNELAAVSGVAATTIIDLELGRREARWVTTRKLAEALKVEPPALIAET